METMLGYLSLAGLAASLGGAVLLALALLDVHHAAPMLVYAELTLAAITLGFGLLLTAVAAGALHLAERLVRMARQPEPLEAPANPAEQARRAELRRQRLATVGPIFRDHPEG